ncbi:methyltransferase PMT10 [Tripterygium wilfordii]|uniref:Methyltransferase n=1 Tax=Tripterygium wilfordii TaxID=458696 RepID=A0A7J7BT83_TRIWF|nr:probable methyltransferase PMT10 [Tripterygium wilfordii]KAF5725300.1 methyltransferase PMT10 [Tripterygium wilfordii]
MEPNSTSSSSATDALITPNIIKFTAFALLSVSFIFLANFLSSSSLPLRSFSTITAFTSPPPRVKSLPPAPPQVVTRTGIIDQNGAMATEFEIGLVDPRIVEELRNLSGEEERIEERNQVKVKVEKFRVCDQSVSNYIPCLDNVEGIRRWNLSRHCPQEGHGLDCLVPPPEGYQLRIPWPQSIYEVCFKNIPHVHPTEDKGGPNWIAMKKDKLLFPKSTFDNVEARYFNKILQMVPDISFGQNTRVALDINCGVANFGILMLQHNVTTLSIAPKDIHENQIQIALERGVPAMVAVFGTQRLLYPSQAFDLILCSRGGINWTSDGGILLLEANRILRAGGFFVWQALLVHESGNDLEEQWKALEDLANRICWELVKKEGYVAIWRKPLNNTCYLNRDASLQPPLCGSNDDPDNVWYVGLKACITRLPDNGNGGNLTLWPARLHYPPDRLQSIHLDAHLSRKDIFVAESKYWNEIIDSYIRAFRWKQLNLRNVLDMRAGFGGFAAALHTLEVDCWVMNVVPVSGFNTLPVIYDRGLIGVTHDWCEPFDTYPRSYDLLHAAGLFSVEQKRCNITIIMLEMDRMLRPGGLVYIRDSVTLMDELQEIAISMGWVPALHETSEGPHASWKILICEKRM